MTLRIMMLLAIFAARAEFPAAAQTAKLGDVPNPLLRPILRPNSTTPIGTTRDCAMVRVGDVYQIAAGGQDKVVRLWKFDPRTQQLLLQPRRLRWPIFNGAAGEIRSVAMNSRGTVAFGGLGADKMLDGTVYVSIDDAPPFALGTSKIGFGKSVASLALHPRRKLLMAALGEEVGETDSRSDILVWSYGHPPDDSTQCDLWQPDIKGVSEVIVLPDGQQIAAYNRSGQVCIVPLPNSADASFTADAATVHDLDVSTESLTFLTNSEWTGVSSSAGNRPVFGSLEKRSDKFISYNWTDNLQGRCETKDAQIVYHQKRGPYPLQDSNGRFHYLVNTDDKLEYLESIDEAVGIPATESLVAACRTYVIDEKRFRNYLVSWNADGRCAEFRQSDFAGDIALTASNDGQFLMAVGPVDGVVSAARCQIRIWKCAAPREGPVAVFPPSGNSLRGGAAVSSLEFRDGILRYGWAESEQLNTLQWQENSSGVAIPSEPRPLNWEIDLASFSKKQLPSGTAKTAPRFLWYRVNDHAFKVLEIPRGVNLSAQNAQGEFLEQFRPQDSTHTFANGKVSQWWGPFRYPSLTFDPVCAISFQLGTRQLLALATSSKMTIWNVHNPRQPLRVFAGHEGRVLDMVFDDGASVKPPCLVSAAEDGTIRAWSLEGLESHPTSAPFRAQANGFVQGELAVKLKTMRDRLFVAAVYDHGLGHLAGLLEGQEILSVHSGPLGTEPVRDMRSSIENAIPGVPLQIEVDWKGKRRATLSTEVTQNPIWSLYPMLDGECVIWGQNGRFQASSKEASRGIGWHTNVRSSSGLEARWDELREDLEDDDEIYYLLRDRMPGEPPAQVPIPAKISNLTVAADAENLSTRKSLNVDFEVEPPMGGTLAAVEVWCNSVRVEQITTGLDERRDYSAEVPDDQLRLGRKNTIVARAVTEADGSRDQVDWEFTSVFVGGTSSPKLHYLGIGVTHLENPESLRSVGRPLKFANNDVVFVGRALESRLPASQRGTFQYLVHDHDLMTNPIPPTRAAFLEALATLTRHAAPNDTAIILMCGHGVTSAGEFRFITEDTASPAAGLSQSELLDKLAQLPCAALLFVDACRSGSLDLERQLDGLTYSPGPLIILSSSFDESSWEREGMYFDKERWQGMGLMSAALLEAITGSQRECEGGALSTRDGPIHNQPMEIANYIMRRVPELLAQEQARPAANADDEFLNATQSPTLVRSLTVPNAPLWNNSY